MSYRKVDDTAAQLLDDFAVEVPEIIKALAERLIYEGMATAEAPNQARDMLRLAMDDPERFDFIFGATYH